MQNKNRAGAERLTLIEQLLARLHVPYTLACLALSLVMGAPGFLLVGFLDTSDIAKAATRVLAPYSQRPAWIAVLDLTVNTAIVFYMLLTIRFMRRRLANAEPQLSTLTPGRESAVQTIFGRVSSLKGQIVTTITLLVFIQLLPQSYPSSTSISPSTTLGVLVALIIAVFFYVTVGTFIWAYISSLWSLHAFGKQPLQLRSFREDRLLGVGAVGSLSLAMAISYYTVFGPVAFESVILSPDLIGYATLLPLVVLGAAMFFLPLTSIHEKMRSEKEHSETALREELAGLAKTTANTSQYNETEVREQVNNLVKLQMLQMSEKRLQDVPTWPFDKRTLEILVAIFLSVLTALLTRLVFAALNL